MPKRINLHLSKESKNSFSDYADQVGYVKSDLLRSWIINSPDKLEISSNNSRTDLETYSFELDYETNSILQGRAKDFGLSKSAFLRSIIYRNLNRSHRNNKFESQKNSGPVSINRLDTLSNSKLKLTVDNLIYRGEFPKANQALDELKFRANKFGEADREIKIQYQLAHANLLHTWTKDYPRVIEIIKNLVDNFLPTDKRNYKGEAYYYLGRAMMMVESFEDNLNAMAHAVDYLDVVTHGRIVTDAYLYLCSTNRILGRTAVSKAYEKHLEKSREISGDQFADYNVNRIKSLWATQDEDYDLAKNLLHLTLNSPTINNYLPEKALALRELGRILIQQGDLNEANKYLVKAKNLQDRQRGMDVIGKAHISELILPMKSSYGASKIKLDKMLDNLKGHTQPTYVEYTKNAAMFVHGDSEKEKSAGLIGLKKIATESKHGYMRKSAEITLKSRQIALA